MGRRVALLLLLAALPAAAQPVSAEGLDGAEQLQGQRVIQVELRLEAQADVSDLVPLLEVRQGQRLSLREVRRTIERLFASGRFADVVVRARPMGAGVAVSFDLTPVRRILGLTVRGSHAQSTEAVEAATKVVPGMPYYPERDEEVRRAVEEFYRLAGYRHAAVQIWSEPKPAGVQLHLAVDERSPTRLWQVAIDGTPGLPLGQVLQAAGLTVGGVFEEGSLQEGMERVKDLLRRERFYRAHVGTPQIDAQGDSAVVTLPMEAGPRFTFHFHGNRSFSDPTLMAVLAYDGQESLDHALIGRLERRLATFYRYQRFMDVQVQSREVLSPGGDQDILVFEILEGAPTPVTSVELDGNRAVSDDELRDILEETLEEKAPEVAINLPVNADPLQLAGRPQRDDAAPEPAQLGLPFVPEAYLEARERMAALYHQHGYLRAVVSPPVIDLDSDRHRATARIEIAEGPLARVGNLVRRGMPAGVDLPALDGLERGAPFNPDMLDQMRAEISRRLGNAGYLFSKVSVQTMVSPDGRTVDLDLWVEPGPKVTAGQVIVRGLVRTREALVLANLKVRRGELLTPDALYDSQRDLMLLGIFRQVSVRLLDPETPEPVKDVIIELKERSRSIKEVDGGYSLAEGPHLIGAVTYPNLLGQGVELTARGKVNYVGLSTLAAISLISANELQRLNGIDYRLNLSLTDPRIYNLMPARIGARLDLVGEQVHRPAFIYGRLATLASLDWAASHWLDLSLHYELEEDRVHAYESLKNLLYQAVNPLDLQRLRFPAGQFYLQSLGPAVTLDFRDDPVNPTHGAVFSLNAEATKDLKIIADPTQQPYLPNQRIFTLKTSASMSVYASWGRSVLAFSLRGGRIFLLDPLSETIAPKRFYLGGATTLRGFLEDGVLPEDRREELHAEIPHCRALLYPEGCSAAGSAAIAGQQLPSEGGTLFTLAKLELRLPVYRQFALGIFTETGNLWLDPGQFEAWRLRYVAGVGFRYVTPIGPLALDLGFNLEPDAMINESLVQVQFSVGLF